MTKNKLAIAAGIGGIVIAVFAAFAQKTPTGEYDIRIQDKAPEINFTWSPEAPADLIEMQAKLKITDDHGIDFSSYRFTIVEAERTLDFPVADIVGREWEQPISLSLIASDPKLIGREFVTIRVSVADDMGQQTEIEKVITFAKK